MTRKKAFIIYILYLSVSTGWVNAQDQKLADSLATVYKQSALPDTSKLDLLRKLAFNEVNDLHQGLKYAEELIALAKKIGNNNYLRRGYYYKGTKERSLNNLEESLKAYFQSAELAKTEKNLVAEGECYVAVADVYSVGNNHPNASFYYDRAINILRSSDNAKSLASALLNTGDEYLKTNRYDSALLYFKEAKLIFDTIKNSGSSKGYALGGIGMALAKLGNDAVAEQDLTEAIKILEENEDYYPICDYLLTLADLYLKKGDQQAALNSAFKSLGLAKPLGLKEQVSNASLKLSELYEKKGNEAEALMYYRQHIAYRDSVSNIEINNKMANLRHDFEISQKDIQVALADKEKELAIKQKEEKQKLNIALGVILGLAIVLLAILINNNRNKQKAYQILDLQKLETDTQKLKVEEALTELQFTQRQLIQSAKMASLGELTAGIAHEIQNPLNFVNNFSEVSLELLDELIKMNEGKLTGPGNIETENIIRDLRDGLTKIVSHGRRADSIVKGMLQHSRTSTGKKEPTDINALADEFLRLSFHGLRAKDKDFNAGFATDFDKTIGKLPIVSQDIGRVLLNLFNNAFYAVNEKRKQNIPGYTPTVSVSTKQLGDKIEVCVKDNGNGIPQHLLDKIFQPFFTTKPTGEGTGLGLSLSYDVIITHGGDIKVKTQEGESTEFIIHLPIEKRPA